MLFGGEMNGSPFKIRFEFYYYYLNWLEQKQAADVAFLSHAIAFSAVSWVFFLLLFHFHEIKFIFNKTICKNDFIALLLNSNQFRRCDCCEMFVFSRSIAELIYFAASEFLIDIFFFHRVVCCSGKLSRWKCALNSNKLFNMNRKRWKK